MVTVRFTQEDLELFCAASRDANPLHMSADYARTTVYGEPVVFGILGTLAAFGCLSSRAGMALERVSIEFHSPLYIGIEYSVQVQEKSPGQAEARILDAGRLITTATFTFRPLSGAGGTIGALVVPELEQADDKAAHDVPKGMMVTGTYVPSPADLAELMRRWNLADKGATPAQLAALLWSSYLVGMKVPGRRATYWWLTMDFAQEDVDCNNPLTYHAAVARFDERLDLIEMSAGLRCGEHALAQATLAAFVRADSPGSSVDRLATIFPVSRQLQGKTALVIGGSRGLGAAISQALALQGCQVVVNFMHSTIAAEQLKEGAFGEPGSVQLIQGDASNIQACQGMLEQILATYGGLDFLICNACPTIRPLGFAAASIQRFQRFVADSVALVSVPMAVFLGAVAERGGWNVVVSSEYARTSPREWPHYVTAKSAVEGLARWTAANTQVGVLVVRPPKLLTDQTNTPFGRHGAMSVEQVAAAVVRRLCESPAMGVAEVMETF